MNLEQIKSVDGLPTEESGMLEDLLDVWNRRLSKNRLLVEYYEGKNRLKDLGIAIPPPLKNVETVVGWPAKAVDSLASRSRFDGFTLDSGDDSPTSEVFAANRFRSTYDMAVTSELINSCAFLTVSRGDESKGEPAAIVSAYSALNASALWDYRRKRIKCGMAVIDLEHRPGAEPEPVWVNLYTDTDVWEILKEDGGWTVVRHPHDMGRPMMEPLRYRPSLDRPFGKSRISRSVMSITDSATRTALRTEVSAEFFTAPQKYILGADDSLFEDTTKWEAYIGNWLALSKDADGDTPQLGQLSQGSMQPHTDYMRSLAARFAGETGVPVSELGVLADNPWSEEAIRAAQEPLIIDAEKLNDSNGEALKVIGMMATACAQDKPLADLTDDERSIKPRWLNPARPSVGSRSDGMTKMISSIPWIAESDVALEEYGFREDQIARLKSDKRRAEAKAWMEQRESNSKTATMYEVSSIIKSYRGGSLTRADAIALFERVGIGVDEAAGFLDDPEQTEGLIDALTEADNGSDTQPDAI